MKELYFSIKRNWLLNILLIFLSSLSLLFFCILLLFNRQTTDQWNFLEDIFENTSIFMFRDGLDTQAILDEEGAVERLRAFYEELLHEEAFLYIGVDSQPLQINTEDFRGDPSFQEGYELNIPSGRIYIPDEGYFYSINALQLNQATFSLFSPQIYQGRGFEDGDFGIFERAVPVLLGHEYFGVYEIGDQFEAYYGWGKLNFEVIGIMEANQVIFVTLLDTNVFLDRHIIMPNMIFESSSVDEVDEATLIFRYLRRLQAFIFIEDTPEAFDTMINTIETLSEIHQIPVYLHGVDEAVFHYNEIRNLIYHQSEVVHALFITSLGLIIGIILITEKVKYDRQKSTYRAFNLFSIPSQKWIGTIIIERLLMSSISIFGSVYYIVFHTALLTDIDIFINYFPEVPLIHLFMFSFVALEVRWMIVYSIGLCIISSMYPIIRNRRLYKGGKV